MNFKPIDATRRQVLRGLGGVTIGLPFLPSLIPGRALGAPGFTTQKRFFCVRNSHGMMYPENVLPSLDTLTETKTIFPGHDARSGKLVRKLAGGDAYVSDWLRAPSSRLTDKLVGKMNVLAGLDVPWYVGHNEGMALGNYYATFSFIAENKPPTTATVKNIAPNPTIDYALAYSPNFYRRAPAQRSFLFGEYSSTMRWAYQNPTSRSGPVVRVPTANDFDPKTLFQNLFGTNAVDPTTKKPFIDAVIEDYRRLKQSNRRISAADKDRLEAHMSMLSDVASSLSSSISCTRPGDPSFVNTSADRYRALVEVAAAGMICGASSIGCARIMSFLPHTENDWHTEAHTISEASGDVTALREKVVLHHRWVFDNILLELARRLDVEEVPGQTFLDNALLMQTSECGVSTHNSINLPVVTLGGAGGNLKTGLFCDYRNKTPARKLKLEARELSDYVGLTYNQYLFTVATALGLSPSEIDYHNDPNSGFGCMGVGFSSWDAQFAKHDPIVFSSASQPLPFLT
ncbi:MAG: DUF1552 domain-containing protein [Deltaproteobacteria bacterium]|nr:DUF1552 domain-containing protein [Deltaproteobacteria bacterium]